jgi:hypothetical protein
MDHETRVWQIVEKIGVGMLTTRFADGLRAPARSMHGWIARPAPSFSSPTGAD